MPDLQFENMIKSVCAANHLCSRTSERKERGHPAHRQSPPIAARLTRSPATPRRSRRIGAWQRSLLQPGSKGIHSNFIDIISLPVLPSSIGCLTTISASCSLHPKVSRQRCSPPFSAFNPGVPDVICTHDTWGLRRIQMTSLRLGRTGTGASWKPAASSIYRRTSQCQSMGTSCACARMRSAKPPQPRWEVETVAMLANTVHTCAYG